jgi:hypothetical protein
VITLNQKPPVGLVLQLGRGLKTTSISPLRELLAKTFEQEYQVHFLGNTGLENCDSIQCYAQNVKIPPDLKTIKTVFFVSVESLSATEDEISIMAIRIVDAATSGRSTSKLKPKESQDQAAHLRENDKTEAVVPDSTVFARLDGVVLSKDKSPSKSLQAFVVKVRDEVNRDHARAEIELLIEAPNLSVLLNGLVIGHSGPGHVLLKGLLAGGYEIQLSGEAIEPVQKRIEVASGQSRQLEIQIRERGYSPVKTILVAGGASTMLLGLGLSAWAIQAKQSAPEILCLRPSGAQNEPCGSGQDFLRFPSESPGTNPNRASIAIAPLGYSLALAGGTWLTASLIAKDEPEAQWLIFASGLAASALSYGLSMAFEGHTGFEK